MRENNTSIFSLELAYQKTEVLKERMKSRL